MSSGRGCGVGVGVDFVIFGIGSFAFIALSTFLEGIS